MDLADIGVTGLATMGRNLARNLARHGYAVAVHNRTYGRTQQLVKEFGGEGTFVPSEDLAAFVASLKRPRRAIIMVKAGAGTDAVIDQLADLMEPGDMIVDGGNAHFDDTRRREAALRERGLHFVGTGISGGEEGALNGPSIMPGGSKESWEALGPILQDISAKVEGVPCCVHVGPDGAGHFVKMVHNGIEYSDMQLIAESYDLLRQALGATPAELASVFREWNRGELDSYLIEITAEVLDQVDAETGKPFVDVVVDQAEQKGTGRWTVQSALDLGVPVTGIAEATFARALSGHPEQRAAAASLQGPGLSGIGGASWWRTCGRPCTPPRSSRTRRASTRWPPPPASTLDLDLGAMATIWRGGCIIRAKFLDRIRAAYDANPALPTLLADPTFAAALDAGQEAWRRVVTTAVQIGVPTPGFSSALAYYDGLRRDRLPAALVQGLRDFFGAHTYRRVDKEGSFHTDWSGDRTEHPA